MLTVTPSIPTSAQIYYINISIGLYAVIVQVHCCIWATHIIIQKISLALPVSALVDPVTLTFDLETAAHYCPWGVQPSTNFGVSRTFRSRLIDQHVSDASRNLATLTFDLEVHSAYRWCGSSCSDSVPTMKFVGLPVRQILGIYCVSSTNRPGNLDL